MISLFIVYTMWFNSSRIARKTLSIWLGITWLAIWRLSWILSRRVSRISRLLWCIARLLRMTRITRVSTSWLRRLLPIHVRVVSCWQRWNDRIRHAALSRWIWCCLPCISHTHTDVHSHITGQSQEMCDIYIRMLDGDIMCCTLPARWLRSHQPNVVSAATG